MGEPMKAQEVFASALCERSLAATACARIALHRPQHPRASALTAAELRLPLLATAVSGGPS